MKIVIPESVEIVSSGSTRLNQFGFLWLILGHENNRSRRRGFPGHLGNLAQNVVIGFVFDILRRIKAKAVEMEFVDPVASVGDEKFTDRPGIRSIEIERIAPVVLVTSGEIIVGIDAKIISVGPEMIVNDVENHR